jgi:hypothetical protein
VKDMDTSKKIIVTIGIFLIAIAGIVFLSGALQNEKYLIHSYKTPL